MADTPKTPETATDDKPATKRRAAKMLQNIERDQAHAAQEKPQQPRPEAPEKKTSSSRKRTAKPAGKPRKQAAALSTQPAIEQPAPAQPPVGSVEAVQPAAAVKRKPITAHLPEEEYQQFEQMIAEAAMQGVVRVSGVMMVRAAFQAFKDMDPKQRAEYLKGLDMPKPGRPFSKTGKP